MHGTIRALSSARELFASFEYNFVSHKATDYKRTRKKTEYSQKQFYDFEKQIFFRSKEKQKQYILKFIL